MNDAERYMLLYGPYTPPSCRLGDKLLCEYRGREVTVGGISEANIQWPCAKRKGPRSPILCGDLIRAVKTESEIAIAFHWRVSVHTVTKWRRALDVPRTNQGTLQLHLAYVPERLTPEVHAMADQAKRTPEFRAKIRALKVGRPLHPNAIAAQRKAVSRPRSEEHKKAVSRRMREVWQHPEEHGLPPCHRWTDEEIAQLGTKPDPAIAKDMGVPTYIVANKRRQLGIPGIMKRWTRAETDLLGTDTDPVVARILGKHTAAVTMKRERLGIPPFVARWSEAEIALLGTDTDRAVAELLGRSQSAVEWKRWQLGIPAYS